MFMTLGLGSADTPHTVGKYIECGATEFFVGYVPQSWLDKYGWEVCPNRRTMGPAYNFLHASELRDITKGIHDQGGTVNFAINAHDNGPGRMGMIHDMFDLFETMDPDGYIIADPAVLCCMKKWGINRKIHLSTGVGCFNSESVRFFCDHFNVSRVVIPRKLTIPEMKDMIDNLKDHPELEYEVMIIGYRCYFNDEDCHSIHSGARRNLCGDVLSSTFLTTNRLPRNWKDMLQAVADNGVNELQEGSTLDLFRKEWLKEEPPAFQPQPSKYCACGMDGELAHTLFQTCGLCVIKTLENIGVQALKVPLRGDEETKLRIVKMVAQVIRAENPTQAFCRSLINSKMFCDERINCYYDFKRDC